MTSRATPNNQLLTLGPWMSELLYKSPCSSWPLSISLLTMYRQWYKRGLTTYMYNSGHMKMESNRLPEWLGLSTIWICMYCTLIYKTTSYGNHFWCECKMQDTSPSKFKSLKNSKKKFYGINVERII